MKEIKLTQGKVALVDDKNFDWLNQYKWHAGTYYAQRKIIIQSQNKSKNIKRKLKTISMHREVMRNKLKDNEEVHHINGNELDNREKNLQVVTRSQHEMLGKKRKDCTSQYKGVSLDKNNKKWRAQIRLNGKYIHLGRFSDEKKAAKAYDKTAKELFGKFARLNFS